MLPKGFQLFLRDFTRGLPPDVVQWFRHSNDPLAVENRRTVRLQWVAEIDAANKRQALRYEAMKREAAFIDPKAPVRPIGSVDPVIAQDMRNRYGSGCWHDQSFIEDCRKKAPQLFYPIVKRAFIGWSKTLENLQAILQPNFPLMLEWKKPC